MVREPPLTPPDRRRLASLARAYGVQLAYTDVMGHHRHAHPEALLAVLRALGAPVGHPDDVRDALRERREALARRGCEPVVVAWAGRHAAVEIRLPPGASGRLACELALEGGEAHRWALDVAALPAGHPHLAVAGADLSVAGSPRVNARERTAQVPLPTPLPAGYHRCTIEAAGRRYETLVLAAPVKAYPEGGGPGGLRAWGVFLPLYAARSARSRGVGDLRDLGTLMDWVVSLGGSVVATLPLLAAFLDDPFEYSPYAPVSRLFWNELYLDIEAIPELERCAPARRLLESTRALTPRATALAEGAARRGPAELVDYRGVMAAKRRVLERLATEFFDRGEEQRRAALRDFMRRHSDVEDYAAFRAVGERRRAVWQTWPETLRAGAVRSGDYDERTRRYHLYVQWQVHEQLRALAQRARTVGQGLYLDVPLGVHASGYDVWRARRAFAEGVSAGAPPDALFTGGQDWGFPPMHPDRMRADGYDYVIAFLRRHLEHAGVLRLDHVMQLHRLFWIPRGMPAREGVYVTCPSAELYAILSIESHRHQALIIGEDLGTVPGYVRRGMARHNIHRTYVAQYEARPRGRKTLPTVPPRAMAGLNSHDMPPFAAWWKGLDVADRRALRLMDREAMREELEWRVRLKRSVVAFLRGRKLLPPSGPVPAAVLRALHAYLASSRARLVIVSLEDLWLERRSQNVPGTGRERPNWRRIARYTLEQIAARHSVADALTEIDALRARRRR